MKGWLKALVTVAVAWLAHAGLAGYLAEHDVVAALLVHRGVSAVLLIALLILLRLFLILVAPAWLLYRVATQISSTVPDKMA